MQRRAGDPQIKRMHGVYTHARNTKKGSRYRGFDIAPAASNPIPPRIATTSHLHPMAYYIRHRVLRVFRLLNRHSRLGGPWVGPINAALYVKLATVTPGATSTLSASSASLFLCRFSDTFSSCLTHAVINLQPPSHTVMYQARGSSAAVLQSPVMPNTRRSSATQSVHSLSFLPDPRFPAFSSSPDMISLVTCDCPCGAAPPTTTTLSCHGCFDTHIRFASGRFCKRGCGCSATCARLVRLEATSRDVLNGACCSGS